mmetsp:Transcript_13197/g.26922  ORF Transcript_13197/g.26922 Transcript_13197/m.26922 type:complete len:133 (+) Transcript_13197:961-1359(+)
MALEGVFCSPQLHKSGHLQLNFLQQEIAHAWVEFSLSIRLQANTLFSLTLSQERTHGHVSRKASGDRCKKRQGPFSRGSARTAVGLPFWTLPLRAAKIHEKPADPASCYHLKECSHTYEQAKWSRLTFLNQF